ncbi:polyamine-modulated factor 1-binding protein 1 isoform X2 [Dasypus novemcinctus]|uniref:polyamine-modulated factor 1-binding protein 1 isoform X2 n=1 Tax=Dasypus novemcinctus TaxID=9361 RepID=UPI0026602F71|nr:polyamine-modulated factor 1-binding protein 1 isoform X2 [Dasypus novemcinctus]
MVERDREVGSLNNKLLSLQIDIKNLHDVCKRQGKALQENQLCVEEAMMMNSCHNKKPVLAFKEAQMEIGFNKQCHLRQLQQLKKKLLALQQELEFRTEELQTSYCSLLQYQSILEKETSELVLLHHHCKRKENEVILYEEMGTPNEVDTGQKLHLAQEQLALASDKIISLERSLNLYRDKYQTSLSNIELLECQVKMLEGELNGIIGQETENKGDHPKVRIYTSPCMIQEHQETLKRLSEVWQKVSEQDDLIQELRNKLACSKAMVLEREESLIKLQADFASYKATHRYLPGSLEECEDIKKILKHLQDQKDSQCLHVEEYQNLVKDLRMELEMVSEQKKNILKDMMKLELDLHGLREETSAQIERKEKEASKLQRQLQELELQLTENKKQLLEKDKVLQEKDEMLQKLKKELAQVQCTLKKTEIELEKERLRSTEYETPMQEINQDKYNMEYEALHAEIQQLKDSLEAAQQQLRQAAQEAAQYREQATQAESNLEDSNRKLQSCISLEKKKSDTIQELQKGLQKQKRESMRAEDELESSRKQIEELTADLSEARRKSDHADKERKQLQKTVDEQEMKLNDTLNHMKLILHQNKDQASAKCNLEDELQDVRRLLEEKREQLKNSKEQEKLREKELEALQQEERRKEKMARENVRKLEEENENLQAELLHCSTQLDTALNKHNTTQKVIQELNKEISQQKEVIMNLQTQLDKAVQKEKHCLQNMVSKVTYEELCHKSTTCQEDLKQALEKLNRVASETKDLRRSLIQAQDKKAQLEEEITAYEERMKKLNAELKKLQGFQQQSEEEREILKKEGPVPEKRQMPTPCQPCCLPHVDVLRSAQRSVPKDSCKLHQENTQIMSNMEHWAQEQKITNEKLGNKLREQVKYIAKLTGEKDHLQSVMVHLQQENKKLKNEIEERKLKAGHPRLYSKTLGPCKLEPPSRERKMCGGLGWRSQDVGQKTEIGKFVGMPHGSGSSYC